jgi:hypothetical protein
MSLKLPPNKLTAATKWSSVNQWARNEPNVNDDDAIDLEAPAHKGTRMNQMVMSYTFFFITNIMFACWS